MRFARLRDPQGRDIHVWVDDNFDEDTARMVINSMKAVVLAEEKMGSAGIKYEFSDTRYQEVPT